MSLCCSRSKGDDLEIEPLVVKTPLDGAFQGRTYQSKCTSTFFKITLVVGVAIGLVGTVFLLSQLLTSAGSLTSFFQRVSGWVVHASMKLSTDPLAFSIFIAAVGGTTFIAGSAGWLAETCKQRESNRLIKKLQDDEDSSSTEEEGETPTGPQNNDNISNGSHSGSASGNDD